MVNYKFIFVLLLFNFCTKTNLISQNYIPFDLENGVWQEYHWHFNYYENYQHVILGDTLINNKVYSKIYKYGEKCLPDDNYYPIPCEISNIELTYIGGIRELNKRIYYVSNDVENMLYDFNVEVGDTITSWHNVELFGGNVIATIESIDSIEYCGSVRKRYKANYFALEDNVYFIEGIGSVFGLIPYYPFFDLGTSLECYSDLNCAPCELILQEVEINENDELNIYPNPFSDELIIDVSAEIESLEVRNITGELMLKNDIPQKVIDMNRLKEGIYFLVMTIKGRKITRKIIKQN